MQRASIGNYSMSQMHRFLKWPSSHRDQGVSDASSSESSAGTTSVISTGSSDDATDRHRRESEAATTSNVNDVS